PDRERQGGPPRAAVRRERGAVMTLTDRQQRLLAQLAAVRQDRFPPSAAQRRQWLLHQLDPRSAGYAVPVALRVHGLLDLAALHPLTRATADLVARHEGLRPTFPAEDGVPIQLVQATGAVPIQRRTGEPSAADLDAEVSRPFDLAEGPLARMVLWSAAPDRHT